MKNFKEIADKCISGKLKGTFKLASGKSVSSDNLEKRPIDPRCTYQYQMYVDGVPFLYNIRGTLFDCKCSPSDIIDFIPNNMKEQIKIDIPEGKVPVMEQTEKGVVITWKEKELTYNDIVKKLRDDSKNISTFIRDVTVNSPSSRPFYKKVEVLRKLTNIRNYFGKPNSYDRGYCIEYTRYNDTLRVGCVNTIGDWTYEVIFKEKEHAEQAIKMLGDELKYLFEPW